MAFSEEVGYTPAAKSLILRDYHGSLYIRYLVKSLSVIMSRKPIWQIPVTETLDKLVEDNVGNASTHVSKSDLVREAVREKLARMGKTENVT